MQKLTLTNNDKLFNVARTYGINDTQLAKILSKSRHTVAKWRLPLEAKGRRNVGGDALQCLRLAILAYQTIPSTVLQTSGVLDSSVFNGTKVRSRDRVDVKAAIRA